MNLSDFPSLCLKVNFEDFSYYSANCAFDNCPFGCVYQGLGVVCGKEGGFGEDDFVVEFLGEVWFHF